jgi:hypothetical protein
VTVEAAAAHGLVDLRDGGFSDVERLGTDPCWDYKRKEGGS